MYDFSVIIQFWIGKGKMVLGEEKMTRNYFNFQREKKIWNEIKMAHFLSFFEIFYFLIIIGFINNSFAQ